MVFWAVLGVGATEIVGSITTGNTRPAWRSHPASAVTVTRSVAVAAFQAACWVTLGLHDTPYGDDASRRASVITGAGMTSTGGPPASRENAIDPPGRCHGTRPPPTLIVQAYVAGADGEARMMLSFSAFGVS